MSVKTNQRATRTKPPADPQSSLQLPRPFAATQPTQRKAAGDADAQARAARHGHDFSRISVRDGEPAHAAAKANRTGLPDRLKAGIERLSGVPLDDVRVHRNSPAPETVLASAHTQGTHIHLGPGQERHLAHEAWHVVQQKQGRVRATIQVGGKGVNDEASLEREADVMGARALQAQPEPSTAAPAHDSATSAAPTAAPGAAPIQANGGKNARLKYLRTLEAASQRQGGADLAFGHEPSPPPAAAVASPPARQPVLDAPLPALDLPRRASSSASARAVAPLSAPAPSINASERTPLLLRPRAAPVRAPAIVPPAHAPAPAAPVRPSQPITGRNLVDFATANTPGPITGMSGTASALASVANPPTTHVPQGFGGSNYVSRLQPASSALSAVGTGTNLATGAADILSIGADARDMHKKGGWSRFWSGLKANFRNPFKKPDDANAKAAEGRSATKRLLVNTATNATDLGASQVPSAWSSVATATGHAAPHVLGTMAAGAGLAVNSVVAARSLYRGAQAATHESNLNALLAKNDQPEGMRSQAMKDAAAHHASQMNKRKNRSFIGAAGAALGAAGGGALLAGVLGAGLMATPIGWGLAAAGGLVAAGLGIHKLWKWHKKRKEGTLGVERAKHADALHAAMNTPAHPDRQDARKLLAARGISPAQVRGPEGKDFLKRKAESW